MNLSIKELNDLYYCVSRVRLIMDVKLISNEECDKLLDKIRVELIEDEKLEIENDELENIINSMGSIN